MAYNENIPQANDRPSDSQSEILDNFGALKTFLDRNHVALDDPSGNVNEGKHTFCQFPEQGAAPATAANEGAIYSKVGTNPAESNMFFRAESNGFEYQITKSISASTGRFGNNTTYVANNNGGWTYLPGGLVLQYGRRTTPGMTGTVTFPVAFPSGLAPFCIVVTNERGSARSSGYDGANSTQFTYYLETAGSTALNWIAIGN